MSSLYFTEIPINKIQLNNQYYGYKYLDAQGNEHVQNANLIVLSNGELVLKNTQAPPPHINIISVFYKHNKNEQKQILSSLIDLNNTNIQNNLIGLHSDLYDVGDARQDKWHVWLSSDWKQMLYNLEQQNYFVLGVAPAPIFSGSAVYPVALVYEDRSSGQRYWQHIDIRSIEAIRQDSAEQYNQIIKLYSI